MLYALLAGIWVLASDQLVGWLTHDPSLVVLLGTFKGLVFVALTALVLWWLLRRAGEPAAAAEADLADAPAARLPWWTILALGVAVLALTAAGIFHALRQQEAQGLAQLHAIADLKSRQLAGWLQERQDDASFIAASHPLGEAVQRWRGERQAASGERLRRLLREFVQYTSFHGAKLFDAQSKQLLWDSEATPVSSQMSAAVAQARAEGQPMRIGPYSDAGGRSHLDYVVALPAAGRGVVLVLHIDPTRELFPMLQTWPEPSSSGEVVWFRRAGDDVQFLNALRHRADAAAGLRFHVAGSRTLAAQWLRGEVRPGQAANGQDYRGVPVFGVAAALPGNDGFLLAKVDAAELYAEAYHEAAWIVLAGLLALLALGVGAHLARQRRDLSVAEQVRQSQAERLRALRLLASIADSSADAIFAKDLAGRFILFNRAAQRLTGKTQEAVLGLDETVLFGAEQAQRQLAHNRAVIDGDQTLTFQEEIDTLDGQRVFLTTKGPLHDRDGRVIGLYGIARDITEREQAEAALRRQLELNQRYLDTVQTIMLALDGDGRITMINRKGCELLGYAEDALLGRNWFEACLPQPEGMDTLYPLYQRILAGETAALEYFENPIRCRDGRRRLIAWHNAYFTDARGRIVGSLSSGEDVTERRDDETALRVRNAELERFNRATVGRELDMIELKKRVNALSLELGREPPYALAFLAASEPGSAEPAVSGETP